jgi:hypothetical protein
MTRRHTIVSTLALMAILSIAMPGAALAGSLLSGYGGPGEGSQAILGSSLLNAPRGGGGSGAASGSTESSSISSMSIRAPAGGVHVAARGSQAPVLPGHPRQAAGATGQTSSGASGADPFSERSEAEQTASDGRMLGLSGADLLYVLLVLCGLALTAVLTRRLTRIAAAGRHK